MKVKMIRSSGNPVLPEKAEEYKKAWQKGFDLIVERHGKYGKETSQALDNLERVLSEEYNDLTVIEEELPKSKKAWSKLLSNYGNVMLTTCVETGKFAKSGDLLMVINDTDFL